jgi:anti-sigma factor RsiW
MNRAADQKFLALLDVYGADQSRWPADAVRQLAKLTGDEAIAAQQALREAEALDRVLARASSVSEARQTALADRIMAAVHEEAGRQVTEADGSRVSASPAAVSNVIALRPRGNPGAPAVSAQRFAGIDWRAAAAMAAALVIGIGVGMSGTASPTFQAVAETVGVSLERSVLAFNDEHGGTMAALDDEDVL